MKAFLLAVIALVAISLAGNRILMQSGFSAEQATTSEQNVRLGD